MKKKLIFIFLLQVMAFNLIFAENNFEIANNYYDKDSYILARDYYEYALFNDKINNGTLFYRLGYSYEQLNYSKTTYSKLYCAAAYCFERDNDKDNKYYSYAIAKEKDLGVNHKSFSEKTLRHLVDDLYRGNRKKDNSYFKNDIKELLCYVIMILIFITIIIVFVFKFIRHFTRYTLKLKHIHYSFSSLFDSSNFLDSDEKFNNLLQQTYNTMVEDARYGSTKLSTPENFLLYKCGQVLFTKIGKRVDYKIVSNGLKQTFFEENVTIETTKRKIKFINEFKVLFHNWRILQKIYKNKLYDIPEVGALLTVLLTKMSGDNFIHNANSVIDYCNKYERIDCKSYRDDLLVIANRLYHEKCNELDLSKKLEIELFNNDKRFSNSLKLFNGKICIIVSKILPIFLFAYSLGIMAIISSITFGKVVITGIVCFLFYKIKKRVFDPFFKYKGFDKLMSIAEKEALERQLKEQANRAANRTVSNNQKSFAQKPLNKENDEENFVPQNIKIHKYYCKYCGVEKKDLFDITNGSCKYNPAGNNHSPFQGQMDEPFYCEFCGTKESSFYRLVNGYCKYSPTKRHIPYEGDTKAAFYYCRFCSHKEKDFYYLVNGYCKNSNDKRHHPL